MAEDEEKKESKVETKVTVTVISNRDQNALVEWYDGPSPRRVTVPAKKVAGNQVEASVLESGVPYGVAWEGIEINVTAQAVADELHRRGIWTDKDLFANAPAARAAVQSACSNIWTQLVESTKKGGHR